MSKKFQRKIEDFVCEKCGKSVKGNGYTNHCPFCFWSKHVDKWPGDRQNECQGLMAPVEVFFKKNIWHLVHRCQKCKEERTIKMKKELDMKKFQALLNKKLKG